MANEHDIRVAVAEVCAADNSTTAPKGLTVLTGKANPIVRWGDRGMNDRPIVTYFQPSGRIRRGTADALVLSIQLDVWVESNSTGQAEKMADRLESIITNTNLGSTARTNPVDVAPYLRSRRELSDLDEGRRRLALEYDFWFTR